MKVSLINPGFGYIINSDPKGIENSLAEAVDSKREEALHRKQINVTEPPLGKYQTSRGLLCIATVLEHAKIETDYVQADYETNRSKTGVAEVLKEKTKGVDIVGITSYTINFGEALKIARALRKINSQIIIVMGGHHVSAMDRETLEDPNIDFVVRGEGEETFLELVKNIRGRKRFENICGISYKDKDGVIIRNPPRRSLEGATIPSWKRYVLV